MNFFKSAREALEPVFKPAPATISDINPSSWNSPQQPLRPLLPPGLGVRSWDVTPGINLQFIPRGDTGINFKQLANVASSFDLVRLLIETRKDQIVNRPWVIRVKEQPGETKKAKLDRQSKNPNVGFLTKALTKPDGVHAFPVWLRMWMEDLLVFDAPCIYPVRSLSGEVLSLRLVSGSTITPLLDNHGFVPLPPDPAYQQIILGLPTANLTAVGNRAPEGSPSNPRKFTADQLVYSPRNPRINSRWGYGPVEQIVSTIQIGSHWQHGVKAYFTEGNIPEGLLPMPSSWTMNQIKEFQNWFDGLLAGHVGRKRRMFAIPDTQRDVQFSKQAVIVDPVVNEYLIRLCAFCFSISPQNLLKQVNRGTAKESSDIAQMEGLEPYLKHIECVMNYDIIESVYGIDDCQFAYEDEREMDPVKQSQVDVAYVNAGIYTRDEVREARGDDPLGIPQGAIPGITTAQGFVPLDQPVGLPQEDGDSASGKPSTKDEQPSKRGKPSGEQ